MKPGPELDKAVADKMGIIPCKDWREENFGSMGGPALIKECIHADGACYPTTELGSIAGTVGGLPEFSKDGHPQALRLRDLPEGYLMMWQTFAAGSPKERVEYHLFGRNGGRSLFKGETEAHLLCVAYLEIGKPRWNDHNRWSPAWKQVAVRVGLLEGPWEDLSPEDVPEPWTQVSLNWLSKLYLQVREQAWNKRAKEESTSNVVWCGAEGVHPSEDPEVEKYMKRLARTKARSLQGDVVGLLNRVWDDPGKRYDWDGPGHKL